MAGAIMFKKEHKKRSGLPILHSEGTTEVTETSLSACYNKGRVWVETKSALVYQRRRELATEFEAMALSMTGELSRVSQPSLHEIGV